MFKSRLTILTLFVVLSFSTIASAKTCDVKKPSMGSPTFGGSTYRSITRALNDGCTDISVYGSANTLQNTYLENITIENESEEITIRGVGDHTPIVNGTASDRVFFIKDSSSVTIEDIVIQNGLSVDPTNLGGGGMIVIDSSVIINRVTFESNNAGSGGIGGALTLMEWTTYTSVVITDSHFNNNTANSGEALACNAWGAPYNTSLTVNTSYFVPYNSNTLDTTLCGTFIWN